ncbi:MAG: hypothetical protein QM713_04750 [Arachnia sp.]
MRTRNARRWLWATLIPAVLLLCAAGWLALQLSAVQVGVQRSRAGDAAGAERAFATAGRLAVVERWVPAFDHGTAQYGLRLWDAAAADFERAAGLAPDDAQCLVRLNWAWSLEAGADELLSSSDTKGGMVRLQQAQLVLSTARCPARSTPGGDRGTLAQQLAETAQRLEDKTGDTPPDEPEAEDPSEAKDHQLADREQQAAEQRQQVVDQGSGVAPDDGQRTW